MAVSTAVMSVVFTLFVSKSMFERFSVIWGYLNIEFLLMFTDGFIWAMNTVETVHEGKLIYALAVCYFECHFGL